MTILIGGASRTRCLFERVEAVKGWFDAEDCGHFGLVLSYQSLIGIRGDLLEIGAYHGRSAAAMAAYLAAGERLVIVDAFVGYDFTPATPSEVRDIVEEFVPPPAGRVDLVVSRSDVASLDGRVFRFVHVDGGHSRGECYEDLLVAFAHLVDGGVVVVDDYAMGRFPGVKKAVDGFVEDHPAVVVFADPTMRTDGRKVYLGRVA